MPILVDPIQQFDVIVTRNSIKMKRSNEVRCDRNGGNDPQRKEGRKKETKKERQIDRYKEKLKVRDRQTEKDRDRVRDRQIERDR